MGVFPRFIDMLQSRWPYSCRRVVEFGLAGPRAGSPESRSSQACARRPIRVCAKLNTRDSRGMTPRVLLRLRVGQPRDGATGDSRLITMPTFAGGHGGNGK